MAQELQDKDNMSNLTLDQAQEVDKVLKALDLLYDIDGFGLEVLDLSVNVNDYAGRPLGHVIWSDPLGTYIFEEFE